MTSRERFRLTLSRQEPDRVPMAEICFWPETIERWRQEGLPEDQDPGSFLGLDPIQMVGADLSLRLPLESIEETEEWKIERDADGTTHKVWKTNYAPPQELDHLIKTREDFARYRERLAPDDARLADTVPQTIREARERGVFCTLNPGEPVWWTLRTLGHGARPDHPRGGPRVLRGDGRGACGAGPGDAAAPAGPRREA